jgi:uncharacterized protein
MSYAFRFLAGTILIFSMMAVRADDPSPSFDCSKARLATEQAICANATLSRDDIRVAQAYKTALQVVRQHWHIKFKSLGVGEDAVRQGQKSWLKERNRCGAIVECLREQMNSRVHGLDALTMQLTYGADPQQFKKPIKLDQKNPQKVDFVGDGTGMVIQRSYIKAKEDGDNGAFVLKLGDPVRGYTEIDIPILSYSIPQSNDPNFTYPDMLMWANSNQQGGSRSDVVLQQDAQVSKSLKAILGTSGTLIGVDVYEDTGCPRSCSAEYLYMFFVDHNLHVTSLLAVPWGYYDGSSAWGNTDVSSGKLTLFAGNNAINAVYLRFESTKKDFWIDQDHPCNPSQSVTTTLYYYRMDNAGPVFKVEQGDPAALESDGDIEDVDSIKVKYILP